MALDFTLRDPADFGPQAGLVPRADFVPRVDSGPPALADSGRAGPAFARLRQAGEAVASRAFLLLDAHSHRDPLSRAGTSSSTVHLDFAASVTERSFMDVLDASRRSSSAAVCFWDRHSILYYPYYPDYPYYSGDYYGPPAQQPVVVNTDNGNTVQLAAEVQHLSDEVESLRSQESSRRYQDDRAAANSGTSLSAKEPAVATVFIFHDGRRISAQSYAISGPTLWIFNENTARKFLVADLNVSATEQANAANGIEFHVPDLVSPH